MGDKVKKRKVTYKVKGVDVTFDELYKVNSSNEEVFDRNLEVFNDLNLYEAYKEKTGLLTSENIKNVRDKYKISQKDFALCLGMGEVSINRFERGAIQSDTIDNLLRMSIDPNNMLMLLNKNKDSFDNCTYDTLEENIKKEIQFEKHKIAKFDYHELINKSFSKESIFDICSNIIYYYNLPVKEIENQYNININNEYITNLKLQKLLYYVQGLSLTIFKKQAFDNKIIAWEYGPIVKEAYDKYKINENQTISSPKRVPRINEGLLDIIKIVIDSYGKLDAYNLIELTHDEDPWIESDINCEMTTDSIRDYFINVYKTKL